MAAAPGEYAAPAITVAKAGYPIVGVLGLLTAFFAGLERVGHGASRWRRADDTLLIAFRHCWDREVSQIRVLAIGLAARKACRSAPVLCVAARSGFVM